MFRYFLGIISRLDKNIRFHYSQDGEDIILFNYTEFKRNGFYVDVGAYHPKKYSNTHFLFQRGWRGINIDANPTAIDKFKKWRPADINVLAGVSDKHEVLDYHIITSESSMNSFDAELIQNRGDKVIAIKKIEVVPLNDLLEKYLPPNQKIDLINIDVEGFEERIICSFDFKKYAPDFFIIEELAFKDKDFMEYTQTSIYQKLRSEGYKVVGKTKRSVIYKKETERS